MCIEISISTGQKCKLAKNNKYCHIHKPIEKTELISKMRSEIEQLKYEQYTLIKNLEELNNELESIKLDAEKYNDIKKFEYIKQELHNYCDTSKLNNIINFIYYNNDICKKIFGKKNNYIKEYKRLKELRNRAAHCLIN